MPIFRKLFTSRGIEARPEKRDESSSRLAAVIRKDSAEVQKRTEMREIRRLRILHVLKSSIFSGAENVVITIIKAMRSEYDMVYVATDGEIRTRLEQEQIPMELMTEFSRRELQKMIRKYRPDVVHAHDFSATVLCATIPGTFRLISHLHYDPPWVMKWNLKTLIYRLCRPRIQNVVTVTGRIFDTMVFADAYRNRQVVLSNPIDQERICRLSTERLPERDSGCDLIFVGRLTEQKNPQRFIELVNQLKQQGFTQIRAWMLGDGELRKECQNLIGDLELQDHIVMKGFQENPYKFIRQSKVLCITSGWEGFGLVAAEANILGIPVLSTKTAGCTEVLGENAWELCTEDGEFIGKIKQLLVDSEKWERQKQISLERARQLITIEEYRQLLGRLYIGEVSE